MSDVAIQSEPALSHLFPASLPRRTAPGRENAQVQDQGAPAEVLAENPTDLIAILAQNNPERAALGAPIVRSVPSNVQQILVLPSLEITYPAVVLEAFGNICREYNRAFAPLVTANQEHQSDYRFVKDQDGNPFNFSVQIDMCGLHPSFLRAAQHSEEGEVRAALKRAIFEIENSLAAYAIVGNIFNGRRGETNSLFHSRFRQHLQALRARHGMPIALLACTQEKYEGMLAFEFGKKAGESITSEEIKKISGFDHFFSPEEFKGHVKENGGNCKFLLYARTSEPISKLKKPASATPETILEDPVLRRIIRGHALTFNIDSPQTTLESGMRINDTKAYLPKLGMAIRGDSVEALSSPEFASFVKESGGNGASLVRGKPMQSSYGCYGHLRGLPTSISFRKELRDSIAERGPYVLQLEKETPQYEDLAAQEKFNYIDRVFFGMNGDEVTFFGGVRTLSPSDGKEVRNGRIHGSGTSLYAVIE